tara:strand:+ start:10268 stop:10798 length:531 start_codon:yes stop_codon:yes gene_type:complete
MLTQNQQQTIQFLTEQFEKLNGSQQPKTKFNLVDIKPLEDKSERIRQLDKEDETEDKAWAELRKNELHRIADLLKEDLPQDRTMVEINTYGCVLSICRIQYLSSGQLFINDFHDSCVKISVELKRKSYWDEYSQKNRGKYTNLYYRLNYNRDVEYSTIEELCATDEFKDTLRKRVL